MRGGAEQDLCEDEQAETDAALPDRNCRDVARGDRSLTPIAVFDNGYSTVFRFP